MGAQRLLHIHLPSSGRLPRGPLRFPPYTIASQLQEHLRRLQLDFKDATAGASTSASAADTDTTHANNRPPTGVTGHHQTPPGPHPPPPPAVVSFTPLPTYTLGRRQTTPLSPAELARLQAPLLIDKSDGNFQPFPVTVLPSPRGGLTTYHGPGQIVLWPVMDLRSRYHKQFTVRCYSRLLEITTIDTLAELTMVRGAPLIQGFTNEEPGVWVSQFTTDKDAAVESLERLKQYWLDESKKSGPPPQALAKIAALGVHLRRHISALGTAINVNMPWPELRDEKINPWARFVPCGLEGKNVTSVAREIKVRGLMDLKAQKYHQGHKIGSDELVHLWSNAIEERVAGRWVDELSGKLGCDGVERMSPREVAELVLKIYEPSEGGQNLELEGKYLEWLEKTAQEKTHV